MRVSSKKQRRVVEQRNPKQKDLNKSRSALRGELAATKKALKKAMNGADRWRKQAKEQKRAASRAGARVERLQLKLGGAASAFGRGAGGGADG